jgi:hypothetical protein
MLDGMGTSILTKKRRPARRHAVAKATSASSGSRGLFERLHEDAGERLLRVALETLETYVLATRETEAGDLARLHSANQIRHNTVRALILDDTISSDEVRRYVNRSRPVVNKMAKQGLLLAIPDGRALRFPRWQFDPASETGLLPHLSEVLAVMDASPFRKAAWFLTQNPRLRRRLPLDLLRAGKVQPVLDEARALVGS